MMTFNYESPKKKSPVDWSGTIIAAMMSPVFVVVTFLVNADVALTICIILGLTVLAIKLRWDLRKYVWFWGTIVVVLGLNVPLLFIVRWPQGKGPTLAYTMPFGIADFLITSGAIRLAEKLFLSEEKTT